MHDIPPRRRARAGSRSRTRIALLVVVMAGWTASATADFFVHPKGDDHGGKIGTLDGRGLDRSPVRRNMVDQRMRARLGEVPLDRYRERYPELNTLDAHYGTLGGASLAGEAFRGVPPEHDKLSSNVRVGKWLHVYRNAKPEMLRLASNRTEADPRFVGPISDVSRPADFDLRSDSPAWKLGFERIPVERIGLQRPSIRRREASR